MYDMSDAEYKVYLVHPSLERVQHRKCSPKDVSNEEYDNHQAHAPKSSFCLNELVNGYVYPLTACNLH